ncbi:hypothetical protein A2769_01510 [Candidatus Daviesbacteria bacterium RIFCSPHIGHO2_01_FULL_37_27]|nr:MAG: hypothetical protein A2769_01510 [Candidatus Daviesbacteria bacterium RIFCSPHIGHO2_01_FULL_37_27]
MQVGKTANFVKKYKKLPSSIQRKVDKQINFLAIDFFHPSLNTKKHGFGVDWWEFRVDYHFRMTGKKINGDIILHTVGSHDDGLGKK